MSKFIINLPPNETSNPLFPDLPTFIDKKRLQFIKKIDESKFPVYLIQETRTKRFQVLKMFPWNEDKDQPCICFQKEVRFTQIKHPNLVSIYAHKIEQETYLDDVQRVSYIIMDYAKNGDLFDALMTSKIPFDDRLIRTYFHQIISGLEMIHSREAAHLDLKLENFLLDENYNLRITDFDLSYMPEDKKVTGRGTVNYRPPEMIEGSCKDPQAADIYSLGISLFLLKTGGKLPFKERCLYNGVDMKALLETNTKEFWKKQCEFLGKEASFFTEEFKRLFIWMTQQYSYKRPTLSQIKTSSWFEEEIYSKDELYRFMNARL